MKKCNKCKTEKEESEFNKNQNKPDGLQARCKECNRENLKKHYYNNEKYYRVKNSKRKKKIREFISSKKLKCSNCPESHIACLDFHHLGNKEIDIAAIANKMWSIERIENELGKCIVLCSNCHRKLHWDEKNTLLV